MEGKAAEASGKSAEQRRAERRQKAVIGEIFLSKKLIVERETSINESQDRFPIPFCEFRVQMRSL